MLSRLIVATAAFACFAAPAAAAPPAKCSFSAEGLCGSVAVPLDRSHPNGAKIDIRYVLFKHTDASKPSLGTIFVTEGGPGDSAINDGGQDGYPKFVFPQLLDRRDLVLIDQRGVGQSGAILCQPLQSENTDLVDAVRRCGQQLGTSSDLYGSADVAKDIDAVRADLGLQQFDFYGGSFAGADIEAYAARFPQHLRSVVLDSPVYLPGEDPFFTIGAKQEERGVVLVCKRSRGCSSANPHPASTLHWLLRRLRRSPVSGVGHDADGGVHHLRVGERRVARLLQNDQGTFLNHAEITAAAVALRRGDSAPLLRLAAENDAPLFHGDDPNDASRFSVGLNAARFCTDAKFPWDKQSSESQRLAQFKQARSDVPANQFAPFSVAGWMVPPPLGFLPDPCITWPAPTHHPEPPIPTGTVVPNVPALVLTGDLDQNVPPVESARVAEMFPNSTVVNLRESGHHTVFSLQSDCSGAIVRHFVQTLQPGDTRCARRIGFRVFARGRFPARVARDRKGHASRSSAARITAAAVTDAFLRSFLGGGSGVGLRGGAFKATFSDSGETMQLRRARFARDLAVSGTVHYRGYTRLESTLRVSGATHGTLHVTGAWLGLGVTRLRIRGVVDGRFVNVTVPAT